MGGIDGLHAALGILFCLSLVVIVGGLRGGNTVPAHVQDGPYRMTPLMTANEVEFFGRLHRALPDCHVFPQVAMSALMQPTSADAKERIRDFRRIAQKRVDWALYDRNLRMIAIVELDDRSHDASKDAVRDSLTASAGIPTIRFESRRKPSERQIRAAVRAVSHRMR